MTDGPDGPPDTFDRAGSGRDHRPDDPVVLAVDGGGLGTHLGALGRRLLGCGLVRHQIDTVTGNVAIHPTAPRKSTTAIPTSTSCDRRSRSFVLMPAKNSTAANSTTAST